MKKTLMLMSIVAMALIFSASTASAWYVSVEPISPVEVVAGDFFYADVFFNPDDEINGNFLQSYEFAIGYDKTELLWNDGSLLSHTSPTDQHTPPSPLMQLFGPARVDSTGEVVENFSAGVFGPSGATLKVKTQLAHVEFTVLSPVTAFDGELDVWWGDSPQGSEKFLVDHVEVDTLGTPGYLDQGPDVGAVPIPSAVLLFASAFLGLIGIRNGLSA